jgi:hypothetical protein
MEAPYSVLFLQGYVYCLCKRSRDIRENKCCTEVDGERAGMAGRKRKKRPWCTEVLKGWDQSGAWSEQSINETLAFRHFNIKMRDLLVTIYSFYCVKKIVSFSWVLKTQNSRLLFGLNSFLPSTVLMLCLPSFFFVGHCWQPPFYVDCCQFNLHLPLLDTLEQIYFI